MIITESARYSCASRLRTLGSSAAMLLLALILNGCVGFAFLFDQLDTLVMWRMDDMLDLTSQQNDAVEPVVVEMQDWLRSDGFPLVVTRLEQADRDWRRQQNMQTVLDFEAAAIELLDRFLNESWSRVKPLISKLTPANASQYREYSEERMEDWFESSTSLEDKLEKRTERFEDWLGDLKQSQLAIIKRHTRLADDEYAMKVDNSRQRRERFLELMLAKDLDTLETLYLNPSNLQTPEYRRWRDQERISILATIDELLPTLAKRQKRHVNERLDDWISKLKEVVSG